MADADTGRILKPQPPVTGGAVASFLDLTYHQWSVWDLTYHQRSMDLLVTAVLKHPTECSVATLT